jgi:peroxiredoxin
MAILGKGMRAPGFELFDADGRRIELDEILTLHPVLVVFFRSGCELCRWALPQLARYEWTFKGQDIEVYYVTSDEARVALDALDARRVSGLHVLSDPDARTAKEYGVEQLPATVLIGPDGSIQSSVEGWDPACYVAIGQQVKDLVAGIRGPLFGGTWKGEPCPV